MISDQPVHTTNCLTAEVSKTVENTYRDINIAFANEVAMICESLGINAFEVRDLVNTLPKDSNAYRDLHVPGAGVGGHCLPKDPWLLKYGLDRFGKFKYEPKMIINSRNINSSMPLHVADLVITALETNNVELSNAKVVVMGLAFLENTDDTRNSPTIPLFNDLKNKGIANVLVHDPYVDEYEGIVTTSDLTEALDGADCAVIVTKHDEYKNLDFDMVKSRMRTPAIVDGRNIFERSDVEAAGFYYAAVGKGTRQSED
jgi:UDP-N-acetyl-D-mannosaminuronic acid dehydrogenase